MKHRGDEKEKKRGRRDRDKMTMKGGGKEGDMARENGGEEEEKRKRGRPRTKRRDPRGVENVFECALPDCEYKCEKWALMESHLKSHGIGRSEDVEGPMVRVSDVEPESRSQSEDSEGVRSKTPCNKTGK